MNIFRIIGDFLHTLAIIFLPISIIKNNSYAGVSHRTQLLLCMVFVTRYLDIFEYFISYYNSFMKFFFIGITFITFLMGYWYKDIDKNDKCYSELLVFAAMMGAVTKYNGNGTIEQIFWSFSELLEALAIVPQVHMLLRTKKITKSMVFYMTCTAFYKLFYCFNWISRYQEEGFMDTMADVAAMVFLGIYGFALWLMVFSGVKMINETDGMLKRNMFSRVMMPTMIFSISSHVNHGTNGIMGSDGAPLVKEIEMPQKEKELIQTI